MTAGKLCWPDSTIHKAVQIGSIGSKAVLPARCEETVPGGAICYKAGETEAGDLPDTSISQEKRIFAAGTTDPGAPRWWEALVVLGRGWLATGSSDDRSSMASWSTDISTPLRLTGIDGENCDATQIAHLLPSSSNEALGYMVDCCEYHNINNQWKAANSPGSQNFPCRQLVIGQFVMKYSLLGSLAGRTS